MAFVPISRVLETGSGSGTGNVTLLGAQGSGEFDAFNERLSVSDSTFYVIVDGAQFEIGYGTYSSATPDNGTFTRDTVIRSSGGTSKISLSGSNFNIFGDIPPEKALVVGADGSVTNVSAVAASVIPKDLASMKALQEPDDNTIIGLGYNTTEGDGLGGLFRWDDTSTATADDIHVIQLNAVGSSPGRFIRERQFLFLGEAGSDPTVDDTIMRRSDTHDIKSKRTDTGVKIIPEVQTVARHASYATLAALKAVASSNWKQGDLIELRGISAEGDTSVKVGTWQASSTNTDSLDVTFVRPDDIAGSNPGRVQFPFDINVEGVLGSDLASTASGKGASLVGVEDAGSLYTATTVEAALVEARKNAFIDGGTIAADDVTKEITVAPRRRYTLTASDTIAGIIGLADGEFCQLIAPVSGSTTLQDEGTTTSGQSLKLSGADLSIQSTDEAVYTITRAGANIKLSPSGGIGGIQTVATFTALKALNGAGFQDGQIFNLTEHTSGQGAGGGLFVYNQSSTATDDNGTIAEPADSTGRFIRMIDESENLTPLMFGAVGNAIEFLAASSNSTTTLTHSGLDLTGRNGQVICVERGIAKGANLGENWLITTISAGGNGSSTLASATTFTVNPTRIIVGTDDTSAFASLRDAANATGRDVCLAGRKYYSTHQWLYTFAGNPHSIYGPGDSTVFMIGMTRSTSNSNWDHQAFESEGRTDYYSQSNGITNQTAFTTYSGSDIVIGQDEVLLASASGIRVGDIVEFWSDGEVERSGGNTGVTDVPDYKRYTDLVEAVDSSGNEIKLRYGFPKTFDATSHSVLVKTFKPYRGYNIIGGRYVGPGYTTDGDNSTGTKFDRTQFMVNRKVQNVTIDGFEGGGYFPFNSVDCELSNCYHNASPEWLDWVSDADNPNTAGQGTLFGPFASTGCRCFRNISQRNRHLADGFHCAWTRVTDNTSLGSKASAYTTHEASAKYHCEGNRAIGCAQGALIRAYSITLKDNVLENCTRYGIIASGFTVNTPDAGDWVIENNRVTMADSHVGQGLFIASTVEVTRVTLIKNRVEAAVNGLYMEINPTDGAVVAESWTVETKRGAIASGTTEYELVSLDTSEPFAGRLKITSDSPQTNSALSTIYGEIEYDGTNLLWKEISSYRGGEIRMSDDPIGIKNNNLSVAIVNGSGAEGSDFKLTVDFDGNQEWR